MSHSITYASTATANPSGQSTSPHNGRAEWPRVQSCSKYFSPSFDVKEKLLTLFLLVKLFCLVTSL